MGVMIYQRAEREALREQANREELVERIARFMREDGTAQPLQRLHLAILGGYTSSIARAVERLR